MKAVTYHVHAATTSADTTSFAFATFWGSGTAATWSMDVPVVSAADCSAALHWHDAAHAIRWRSDDAEDYSSVSAGTVDGGSLAALTLLGGDHFHIVYSARPSGASATSGGSVNAGVDLIFNESITKRFDALCATTVSATNLLGTTVNFTNIHATTITGTTISGNSISGGNAYLGTITATIVTGTTLCAATTVVIPSGSDSAPGLAFAEAPTTGLHYYDETSYKMLHLGSYGLSLLSVYNNNLGDFGVTFNGAGYIAFNDGNMAWPGSYARLYCRTVNTLILSGNDATHAPTFKTATVCATNIYGTTLMSAATVQGTTLCGTTAASAVNVACTFGGGCSATLSGTPETIAICADRFLNITIDGKTYYIPAFASAGTFSAV